MSFRESRLEFERLHQHLYTVRFGIGPFVGHAQQKHSERLIVHRIAGPFANARFKGLDGLGKQARHGLCDAESDAQVT